MRRTTAPLFAAVMVACATSNLEFVPIPVDNAGLAQRLRRACEFGKGTSTEGACIADPLSDEGADATSNSEREDGDDGGETEDSTRPGAE